MDINNVEVHDEVLFDTGYSKIYSCSLEDYLKFGTGIIVDEFKPFYIYHNELLFNIFDSGQALYDYILEWFRKVSLKVSQDILKELPFVDKYKDISILPSENALKDLNNRFYNDLRHMFTITTESFGSCLNEREYEKFKLDSINRLLEEM